MAISFKMLSGLDIRLNGDGFVTEQSLSAGTIVNPSEPIVLQLQVPSERYKVMEEDENEEEEEAIIGG